METYYCCNCFSKIVAPAGYIKCKCEHHYIFWASFEKNNYGNRPHPLWNIPNELVDIMKNDGFTFQTDVLSDSNTLNQNPIV